MLIAGNVLLIAVILYLLLLLSISVKLSIIYDPIMFFIYLDYVCTYACVEDDLELIQLNKVVVFALPFGRLILPVDS